MFNVLVSGFETKAEAEAFIQWYEGQGEQDAEVWFDCRKAEGRINSSSMPVDCQVTYPIIWRGDTTHMALRMIK